MRKTLSLDLRERILSTYDKGEGTRAEIAHRFRVSLGMVKKLLQQRRQLGDIAPLHHRAGRKPKLGPSQRQELRALLRQKCDHTLREMRAHLGLECSLQAIHTALAKMGLTLKKRRSARASRTARTLPARGARGGAASSVSTRRA